MGRSRLLAKATLLLPLLCLALVRVSQGQGPSSMGECKSSAARAMSRIMGSAALGNLAGPIDSDIRAVQSALRSRCAAVADLFESASLREVASAVFLNYFDPSTLEPTALTDKGRLKEWAYQRDRLRTLARWGPRARFETEALRLEGLYLSENPHGVERFDRNLYSKEPLNPCGSTSVVSRLPPVRNQGSSGWCSLFTFADLLSVEGGVEISASYLGHMLSPSGAGGVGEAAVNRLIQDYGLCREETLPSGPGDPDLPAAIAKLQEEIGARGRGLVEPAQACVLEGSVNGLLNTRLFDPELHEILSLAIQRDGTVSAPRAWLSEFRGEVSRTRPTILTRVAADACRRDRAVLPRNLAIDETATRADASQTKLLAEVDAALDSGKPAGVGYQFDLLSSDAKKYTGASHWSSVVARRASNGRCQYLLRNSWGPTTCQTFVPEADACRPPGHFWVDGSWLAESMASVAVSRKLKAGPR